MTDAIKNIIVEAKPDAQTFTVALKWHSGQRTISNFSELVGMGVFTVFNDPNFFVQVSLGRGGRELSWPGGLDFDADSLWFQAHPEDAPKVPRVVSRSLGIEVNQPKA